MVSPKTMSNGCNNLTFPSTISTRTINQSSIPSLGMDSDLLSPEVHQTQALPKVVVLFIGFSLIVMHSATDNIILATCRL